MNESFNLVASADQTIEKRYKIEPNRTFKIDAQT